MKILGAGHAQFLISEELNYMQLSKFIVIMRDQLIKYLCFTFYFDGIAYMKVGFVALLANLAEILP